MQIINVNKYNTAQFGIYPVNGSPAAGATNRRSLAPCATGDHNANGIRAQHVRVTNRERAGDTARQRGHAGKCGAAG